MQIVLPQGQCSIIDAVFCRAIKTGKHVHGRNYVYGVGLGAVHSAAPSW